MTTATKPNNKHWFEIALLTVVFALTIAGVIICFVNKKYFEDVYTREDGFVENFTLFPLLIAVGGCINYLIKLGKYKSWLFKVIMVLGAVFSFFVAGEEISWGQRIFHIQSSEYFREHNAQQETNLHNLVVDGEKVNKIIFTIGLSVIVAIYLFMVPLLYSKSPKVKHLINWAGIPIPRNFQLICVVIFGLLLALIHSAKNSEILEMGISSIFLLILLYPKNTEAFSR